MNRYRKVCGALSITAVLLGMDASCIADTQKEAMLVRITAQGGGMVAYYSTFELKEDGSLDLLRRAPSGASMERRRIQVTPDELQSFRTSLDEGQYFSSPSDAFESRAVKAALGTWEDIPNWRIEVFRDGSRVAVALVPPRASVRFHPELKDVPYVAHAWSLIDRFQELWDEAEKVES